jgi:hypothetical protein
MPHSLEMGTHMEYSEWKVPLTEQEASDSKRLYEAAFHGNLQKMEEILLTDTVGIADFLRLHPSETTLTIYLEACNRKRKDAVNGTKLLVRHGANISTVLEFGETAISLAVQFNMVQVVEYLIAKGASVAIHDARSIDMLNMLISHGGDIRSRDGHGRTILHHTKKREIRRFAIDHGVDIDSVNMAGETALHAAVFHSDVDSTRDLCDLGASLDIRDAHGMTPLLRARQIGLRGHRESATLKIVEDEPMRRQAMDLICAVLSDPRKQSSLDRSSLDRFSPDEKEMIMRKLGYIPDRRLE